ncbi:MAG: hypothetical protein ACRDHZ_04810, partial [Ktedonobacteraceae bacterium]
PCDAPFTLTQTNRSTWGEELNKTLLLTTRCLCWEYVYPAERRLREIVWKELAEKRRVMVYIEQNELRSMSKRLAWLFKDIPTWTLPNSVKSEDRQQAILDTVKTHGIHLLFVPYRKVNEGLNLQSAIDTIVWYELAMNLFLLDQASRRAWRLGKQEEVRIYYVVYAGTAGHSKLRKLGNQSGAAAAFAGEPARGALIEHAGADQTTLARLAASVDAQQSLAEAEEEDGEDDELFSLRYSEDEAQQLKAAFARRAMEERDALKKGRQWLGGVVDTLPKRLPAFFAGDRRPSVWQDTPQRRLVSLPDTVDSLNEADLVDTATSVVPEVQIEERVVSAPVQEKGRVDDVPSTPVTTPLTDAPQRTRVKKAPAKSTATHKDLQQPGRKAPREKATTTTTNGNVLIFGNEEHIALVRRPKRSRKPVSLQHPKRAFPVEVCTIAVMDGTTQAATEPQAIPLSLWDAMEDGSPIEQIAVAQPGEKQTFTQQQLW